MPTIRFEEIRARRARSGKCPTCGRRVIRKFNDAMTVNPWNKNPDGTVRSRDEVRAAIEAVADAWVPDFEHAACRAARKTRTTTPEGQTP